MLTNSTQFVRILLLANALLLINALGSFVSCGDSAGQQQLGESRIALVGKTGKEQLILEVGDSGPEMRLLGLDGELLCHLGIMPARVLDSESEENDAPSIGLKLFGRESAHSAEIIVNDDGSNLELTGPATIPNKPGSRILARALSGSTAAFYMDSGIPNEHYKVIIDSGRTVVECWQSGECVLLEAGPSGGIIGIGPNLREPIIALTAALAETIVVYRDPSSSETILFRLVKDNQGGLRLVPKD